MTREETLKFTQERATRYWAVLRKAHPKLHGFDLPEIQLNARFTRTAGMAYQANNRVELAWKFMLNSKSNFEYMQKVILPHELAHMADYYLFGESEKRCGHGKNWAKIMVQLGLPPEKYHTLEIVK